MASLMNRVLMAYRPLYLRGLLMDGQYRLPPPSESPAPSRRVPATKPSSPDPAMPSGLFAGNAIAAAARHSH